MALGNHTTAHDQANMLIRFGVSLGFRIKIRTVNSKDCLAKALILLLNIFKNYSVENSC